MEFSVLFARHLARLVWLNVHEPRNVEEQKAALRAMVAVSKFGAITVESRDWQIVANGFTLPDSASGAMDLVAQMAAHGVRAVRFEVAPSAAHVLGIARLFANAPTAADPGLGALAKVEEIGATGSIALLLETPSDIPVELPTLPVATTTPRSAVPKIEPVKPTPSNGNGHIENGTVSNGHSGNGHHGSNGARATPGRSVPMPNDVAPSTPPTSPARLVSAPSMGIVPDEGGGLWRHFAAQQAPKGSAAELLERLDRFTSVDAVTHTLDDVVVVAETAAREGKPLVVADVFSGLVKREAATKNEDIRRAYQLAIRRMSRPALLRAVAHLLPRKKERREELVAVLTRTGEDGADALIDQLTQAQTAEDRRAFFDVLLELQAGVPALIHMLGDARWFVARNAAELLGEMKAHAAEEPIKTLLRHQDERVRRSATTALMRLDTDTAKAAIHGAMRDSSAQVRMQAAAAIARRDDGRSAGTLTKALDAEVDPDVQLAIISALGKVATAEAVQRLVRAAEPEGRIFFKKKPTPVRVAAVNALGEARTPAAVSALESLKNDRVKDVREAVARALQTNQ